VFLEKVEGEIEDPVNILEKIDEEINESEKAIKIIEPGSVFRDRFK